jgi:hypothetical protein
MITHLEIFLQHQATETRFVWPKPAPSLPNFWFQKAASLSVTVWRPLRYSLQRIRMFTTALSVLSAMFLLSASLDWKIIKCWALYGSFPSLIGAFGKVCSSNRILLMIKGCGLLGSFNREGWTPSRAFRWLGAKVECTFVQPADMGSAQCLTNCLPGSGVEQALASFWALESANRSGPSASLFA